MDFDELTDFDDWTDIRLSLAPWTASYDTRRSLVLIRSEQGVHVHEPPGAWRARHRRQLHQLGFRARRPPGGGQAWEWAVPEEEVKAADNERFDVGANSMSVVPVVVRLRRIMVTDRLVLDRAIVVLRDVFRLAPGEVRIAVPAEGSDEQDGWQLAQ